MVVEYFHYPYESPPGHLQHPWGPLLRKHKVAEVLEAKCETENGDLFSPATAGVLRLQAHELDAVEHELTHRIGFMCLDKAIDPLILRPDRMDWPFPVENTEVENVRNKDTLSIRTMHPCQLWRTRPSFVGIVLDDCSRYIDGLILEKVIPTPSDLLSSGPVFRRAPLFRIHHNTLQCIAPEPQYDSFEESMDGVRASEAMAHPRSHHQYFYDRLPYNEFLMI